MNNSKYDKKAEINYIRAWALIITRLLAGLFLILVLISFLTPLVDWITSPMRAKSTRASYLTMLKKSSPSEYEIFLKSEGYKKFMAFTSEDSVIYFYQFDPSSPIFNKDGFKKVPSR